MNPYCTSSAARSLALSPVEEQGLPASPGWPLALLQSWFRGRAWTGGVAGEPLQGPACCAS